MAIPVICVLAIIGLSFVRSGNAAHSCDSNSPLCLEPKGQFSVPNECKKFANCWENCATLSSCPGTLIFNDVTNKCDFAWNLAADHQCFKPMGNIGGGIIGHMGNMPTLAPLNPLNFPSFNPNNLNNMQQQFNQDGSMSQTLSNLFGQFQGQQK